MLQERVTARMLPKPQPPMPAQRRLSMSSPLSSEVFAPYLGCTREAREEYQGGVTAGISD